MMKRKERGRGNRFISVRKYQNLALKCHNCKGSGRVTGGAKSREEAKKVGTCGYCGGTGERKRQFPNQRPIGREPPPMIISRS